MNDRIEWGRAQNDLFDRWPKNEKGEPVEPVLLCNRQSPDMVDEITINMLEAYGIPCIRKYPGDGGFAKVVLGMSGEGSDIYVPETMLEDAVNLMNSTPEAIDTVD